MLWQLLSQLNCTKWFRKKKLPQSTSQLMITITTVVISTTMVLTMIATMITVEISTDRYRLTQKRTGNQIRIKIRLKHKLILLILYSIDLNEINKYRLTQKRTDLKASHKSNSVMDEYKIITYCEKIENFRIIQLLNFSIFSTVKTPPKSFWSCLTDHGSGKSLGQDYQIPFYPFFLLNTILFTM